MKAMVQHRYGAPTEVLSMAEVETPTVGPDEVLVRVRASSANPYEWHFVRGEPLLMRPFGTGGVRRSTHTVPGGDVAGTVERLGERVTTVAVGDDVYGFPGHGAYAEQVAVPQGRLARMPAGLTYEEAAAVPLAGVTALQALRHGGLEAGQHVLVIGASGGVGTFAVQIARHLGAGVTGVCRTRHVDLVQSLGADHVIDYTTAEVTAGDVRYDLVVQLGGTTSARALRQVLTPGGTLVQAAGDGGRLLGPLVSVAAGAVLNVVVRQRISAFTARETTEALDELRVMVETGAVRPVVHAAYPLAQAAEAVRVVEEDHPGGKVVLTVP
jgi:NADPH:quinone reductase-like Zn-dependent oxidoreductase